MIYQHGLVDRGRPIWRQSDRYLICSADHFHEVEGAYVYKPENAAAAHASCLKRYVGAVCGITGEPDYVFVDNTNCTAWEISIFYQLASAFGHDVEIVYLPCSLETSIARNTHNVPHSTILAMHRSLQTESLLPFWKVTIVPQDWGK
jgi:hypothetical protein